MDCGIEIEDLSEDEILQAVAEMEAWLSGEYSYDEKYKDFQIKALDQLKELEDFEKYHGFINENLRIGYCGYELNRSSWL